MKTETLEYYLINYNTLTPTDQDVGQAVVSSEWWQELKNYFDDVIWLYYANRYVFATSRYSNDDEDVNVANIRRAFSIWLKLNKHNIDRLYVGYMAEFNPLWNVDGVTGHVSKDVHSGTVTDTHEGSDVLSYEDNGSLKYKGETENKLSGTDTTENANTTYESGNTFYPESKNGTIYGKTNTEKFTNREDERDYDGFKSTEYDSSMTKENDLLDEHVDLEIRQGNIGVTKSTELVESNQTMYMKEFMQLWKWIVRMCVNQVSYSVEGVL